MYSVFMNKDEELTQYTHQQFWDWANSYVILFHYEWRCTLPSGISADMLRVTVLERGVAFVKKFR